MAGTGENVALVTQTLVANASTVLSRPETLTLPLFLDLCALCEAVVLLDRLEALGAADEHHNDMGRRLAGEGLYRTFHPTLSPEELRHVMLRLPDELAKRITLDAGGRKRAVDATGAVTGLDYTTGLNNLLTQVDALGGYASSRNSPVKERMYRGNGYLIVAAAHGLDYFPDFDRVPFVAGTLQKTYRSLPRQLYDKVSESLDEPLNGGDLVAEWAAMSTIPIPPISALVLSRASSLGDVPEQLLRVRDEFRRYRRYFGDFKAALRTADTIRERRKLLVKYQALLAEASGPEREIVSLTEMLNLTEKAVKAAAGPALPTSYGALLVTQPADWIRRWWQRRPLAILFRLDSKLPRLPEYRQLVGKLWGEEAGHHLLGQVADHGVRLRTLMADAEPDQDQPGRRSPGRARNV
jgi:hypothetical protein